MSNTDKVWLSFSLFYNPCLLACLSISISSPSELFSEEKQISLLWHFTTHCSSSHVMCQSWISMGADCFWQRNNTSRDSQKDLSVRQRTTKPSWSENGIEKKQRGIINPYPLLLIWAYTSYFFGRPKLTALPGPSDVCPSSDTAHSAGLGIENFTWTKNKERFQFSKLL